MMKMNLDTQDNSTWYRGNAFDDADLVTSESSNPGLGITRITFEAPQQKQADAGVLANVRVNYGRITFRGSVWAGKSGQSVRFSPDQRKTTVVVNGKEESRYIDIVQLDSAIVAQILRYAETFIDAVSEEDAKALAEAKRQEMEQKKAELEAQLAAMNEAPAVSDNMSAMAAAFSAGGTVDNGPKPF